MAQNKVMKMWIAVVTAFLALCTALGFITTTAAAAVPQAEAPRNSTAKMTLPTTPHWTWSYRRALPPTMKQRIHAEAHGSSPSCRHRPSADDARTDSTGLAASAALRDPQAQPENGKEPFTPLRR